MLQKTEGIVIHTIQYSDTSIIAKIFTADHGLLSFMVNGTRGKKSANKAVLFQPLSILALDIYHQENKNLKTIKESKLLLNPAGIYGNIHKTSVVLFMAEVLQKVLKENSVHPTLYDLLKQKMTELNDQSFHPDFHLYLLLDIANELGFHPFNNYSAKESVFSIEEGKFVEATHEHFGVMYLNENDSKLMNGLLSNSKVQLNTVERRGMLMELMKYFQVHNPGMSSIRSIAVLQEVL